MTNHCIVDNEEPTPAIAVAHSLYDCDNTHQLMRFYHACLFSPVLSTLINVIDNGYLKGFPGPTAEKACRHITINNAKAKGHMDQTRQGQCTTHPTLKPTANLPNNDTVEVVTQKPNNAMTNLVYMHTTHEITGQIYTNQTGRFPLTSTQGHAYLIILYIYDANFILSVPIKKSN
jgi:hypothetical protein